MFLAVYLGMLFIAPGTQAPKCTAYPPSIGPGDTSIVTCHCPLVTSWNVSAGGGSISGSPGNTAVFSSYGSVTGDHTILAQCQGELQPESVTVTVGAPLVPAPAAQPLCSLGFDYDKSRPTRVDNAAKACLDEVALVLHRDSLTTLLLVGEDAEDGTQATKRAQQRAVNTKDFLVRYKGIDASRIKTVISQTKKNHVEIQLIPQGVIVSQDGLSPVDESKVKPISRYRRDY